MGVTSPRGPESGRGPLRDMPFRRRCSRRRGPGTHTVQILGLPKLVLEGGRLRWGTSSQPKRTMPSRVQGHRPKPILSLRNVPWGWVLWPGSSWTGVGCPQDLPIPPGEAREGPLWSTGVSQLQDPSPVAEPDDHRRVTSPLSASDKKATLAGLTWGFSGTETSVRGWLSPDRWESRTGFLHRTLPAAHPVGARGPVCPRPQPLSFSEIPTLLCS